MGRTIGMLLDGYYPSDIRVQKEATALINAGFKVALLCKRRKGESVFDAVDGIDIMRVKAGNHIWIQGIFDIIIALGFSHPVFGRNLRKFILQFEIDTLHVHDLPLTKTAWRVAKKHSLKIIADFHENYPEALRVWFQWKKNPLIRLKNKLFFGYQRWHLYEKWAVNQMDYVIAVVEEMKERLTKEYKVADDKVIVVSNTESRDFVKNSLDENIYGADKDKFIVAYTGGVGPHRGVDTAIEAMRYLQHYQEIILYITGRANHAVLKMMQQQISKAKLTNVRVLGYRPFTQFYSFMKMASVNLIPHHSNDHTDNTVPHKLFQCMMVGKPLLVSSSRPLQRIVSETNCGLVFKAGDAKDLADKILRLYNEPALRKTLGKAGFEASFNGAYNWETTAKKLVGFYSKILN